MALKTKVSPRCTKNLFLILPTFFPRCYLTEGDVFVEMLVVREKYLYEYLGDCSHQVWDRSFEKSMYTFLTAFSMKQFPWLKGPTASGKHVLVHEVSRILAQNLVVKSITPMTSPTQIIQYFKGCAFSGSWLCCSTLDRLAQDQLSTLVPWMQAIAETLKRIRKKKSSGKAHLPNGETLVVSAKSFLCFTSSPLYKGRYNLPPNMNVNIFSYCKIFFLFLYFFRNLCVPFLW